MKGLEMQPGQPTKQESVLGTERMEMYQREVAEMFGPLSEGEFSEVGIDEVKKNPSFRSISQPFA